MHFRHELKHEISVSDMYALRSRLSAVLQIDSHALDGRYQIRSLYFDDMLDSALYEKLNGVNMREKFRLRYYNGDTSFIVLEKKSKLNGLCAKEQLRISFEETEYLISGAPLPQGNDNADLLNELCYKIKTKGLKPKALVDYTREPYIYEPGNVRVTLDYNIRTGLNGEDFLNMNCVTLPVPDSPVILEVKWDDFLPSVIRDIVQLKGQHSCAFSKYAACRIYI